MTVRINSLTYIFINLIILGHKARQAMDAKSKYRDSDKCWRISASFAGGCGHRLEGRHRWIHSTPIAPRDECGTLSSKMKWSSQSIHLLHSTMSRTESYSFLITRIDRHIKHVVKTPWNQLVGLTSGNEVPGRIRELVRQTHSVSVSLFGLDLAFYCF